MVVSQSAVVCPFPPSLARQPPPVALAASGSGWADCSESEERALQCCALAVSAVIAGWNQMRPRPVVVVVVVAAAAGTAAVAAEAVVVAEVEPETTR